jgi:hypothetical protein
LHDAGGIGERAHGTFGVYTCLGGFGVPSLVRACVRACVPVIYMYIYLTHAARNRICVLNHTDQKESGDDYLSLVPTRRPRLRLLEHILPTAMCQNEICRNLTTYKPN